MPEISRFYGILIRMYLIDNEHPPRHIHVKYNDNEAVISLETLDIIEGKLPKRCLKLVKKWSKKHQDELIYMWDSQDFYQIEPLK